MTVLTFDVVVVGAGPAGATAALHAAAGGRRVCLVERLSAPSRPVRCGEGVGLKGISLTLPMQEHWILSTITRVKMLSPDGTGVELADIGESYIIDRERFDTDLVAMARAAGVVVKTETPIEKVERGSDELYRCTAAELTLVSPCLVLADGVESRLGRQLGWHTALAPDDIETCAFARVEDPSIAADAIEFHVGNTFAPGGYAWVMPRGKGIANVGLGILGGASSPGKADELLSAFIAHRFPEQALVSNRHCGGVPVAPWISPLVRGGALLVGDAARQVNALNGGGLAYAIHAGKLAGEAVNSAFGASGFNEKKLSAYQTNWAKGQGRKQLLTCAMKDFLIKRRDDAFYNTIAHSLQKKKTLGYLGVFLRTFAGHPFMMYKAFRLFT